MKKMKKLALSLLLAMPMVAGAAGMGVYVPFSVGDSADVTLDSDYGSEDINLEFKSAAGLGIAFDSNIGKDKLFNYRLGLEYMTQEIDTVDGDSCGGGSDCDFTRLNMVNTFGFGVLRTKTVRLWVGPRINLAYNTLEDNSYGETFTLSHVEFGVAPAVGVNVNLGSLVSLGADLDYRFSGLAGTWEFKENSGSDNDTYSGGATGVTARFYVLFRFGEEFQKSAN